MFGTSPAAMNQRLWRLNVIKKLGGCCFNCSINDFRALQIDHKHGGGVKEIRNFKNTYSYYKHLDALPFDELRVNYQVLCANCNWIKRYEKGEQSSPENTKPDTKKPCPDGGSELNSEKSRRGRSEASIRIRRMRLEIIDKLGGGCSCGFSDYRALQIDHKHGKGNREIRRFNGRYDYYKHLNRLALGDLKENYQLLCANCNWIKRYEHSEQTLPGTKT